MYAGIVTALAGSCRDGGVGFEGFVVRICVPKFCEKYSNCTVSHSTVYRASQSSFSLLAKHALKSMIDVMLSGPTGMSTRLEEETECAEADPLLYARTRCMTSAPLSAQSLGVQTYLL